MKNNLKYIVAVLFITTIGFVSCKKTEYSFGNIKTPTGLTLTTAVVGVDATNPNGNGTGSVTITAKATDALTYNIDFGDGDRTYLGTLKPGQFVIISPPQGNSLQYVIVTASEGIYVSKVYRLPVAMPGMMGS